MPCSRCFVSQKSGARGGFTLVELLVTVSIIAILAGLVIPAVQSVREAGRRAQCVSNLRQIGLALHSYESVHGMFPPGQLTDQYGTIRNSYSEFAFVLPYLEQGALFSSINMDFHDFETASQPLVINHTARNTRLSVYLCPGDGEQNHSCSYRLNRGRFGRRAGSNSLFDGPFGMRVIPRASAISDGLSNTAFASERFSGDFTPGSDSIPRNMKIPDPQGFSALNDEALISHCLAAPALGWEWSAGRYWLFGDFVNTGYNHNGTPNDRRPTCGPFGAPNLVGGAGGLDPPRSFHPGCVNVLFGDGHVERITESVSQAVWTALGTYDFGDQASHF